MAEYKRQFRQAFRRPDDDPSIFTVELETLAGRVFSDVDSSIQWQMVRDRFIDGQAECALRQHLDSFGPNTVVVCGKVITRPGSVVTMAQARIHHGGLPGDRGQPVTRWVDRVGDV